MGFEGFKITNDKPPCARDCPNRKVGCHARCEVYQLYRKKREKVYKQKMEYETVKIYMQDTQYKISERQKYHKELEGYRNRRTK